MQRFRGFMLLHLILGGTLVACGEDPPATVLQKLDLEIPEAMTGTFDRNALLDAPSFTDSETLQVTAIQRFFGNTPYGRPSFLDTYQSNGVRAADAIMSAAKKYRINPIVFIVAAQTAEGLVGERNYPFPPDRVEYVFRCGCLESKKCMPELAGFDRQVECLGRAVRDALDTIKVQEATPSGWGPNRPSLTLDNLKVTPANDATAVLYDRTPRVNEGKPGGTWVFWNVWNIYSAALDYFGGFASLDGRWIGEPCVADASCGFEGAICATNYPEGLCTSPCSGLCPIQEGKPQAFCAKFRDGGFCFPVCNPSAPAACRQGYQCVRVAGAVGGESQHVCSPMQL